MKLGFAFCCRVAAILFPVSLAAIESSETNFAGAHYCGSGDIEYLRLLDTARRMFEPDAEFQNLSMLYEPKWNGLVEGPTWDAWWIQNSYGTTYAILPFLQEPFLTFLQNSQDLWFNQMGDGKRVGAPPPFNWVAPDGCLCDAARPGYIIYKQGDGRVNIHDWGMEFTAAGVLLQSELLLISRDTTAIAHYLPMLERSVAFVESRRDPRNNLLLAGPAANLLAPSYAGWRKPDGSYGKAYLAGLSVTFIAALDRMIELEKLAGKTATASRYLSQRNSAWHGLALLQTDDGCLIRSLDPDGVKHGVFGAERNGYFEASPNHDAIAFHVVDESQSRRIFDKIASIPQLRPHDFILPNFPSYDDMYEKPEGLWAYGTWVNGGHWSTCEARMMLAYYRLGKFEDARRSMLRLLAFAEKFRMDNPLTKCGSDVYQPNQPINLCYDSFGPAAAFMRGLFEYLYDAEGVRLITHIPAAIRKLEQRDPVRFGSKKLYLSTLGTGPITSVKVNGHVWKNFDASSIFLPYSKTPLVARVQIALGDAQFAQRKTREAEKYSLASAAETSKSGTNANWPSALKELQVRAAKLRSLREKLRSAGFGERYEATHVELALETIEAIARRHQLQRSGKLHPLLPPSDAAAESAYVDAARKLCDGLDTLLKSYALATDPIRKKIFRLQTSRAGESPKAVGDDHN